MTWFPASAAMALFLLSFHGRMDASVTLTWSLRGAAFALLAWQAALHFLSTQRRHGLIARTLTAQIVLRKQHYIQAAVQLSVYLYWGFHWRPVYDHLWLLAAQLLFAYAFDMLLSWSRGRSYVLGFGAFPIVFSTNLFLWFRDDWFHMQFLMLAAGFLGKEFIRWNRDGKSTHIFNPSAFTLALFSLVLIVTGTTHLTWGQQIASTLTLAPYIYVFLFGVGLVVMYYFSITLIAGTAAVVLFAGSALYASLTGVPYFLDSDIPAAVFLGLHLLVTDPSTSPRTSLGKAIFGALYGAGVMLLYALLAAMGAPTFYDKLLCVPLLNLSVKWIDRLANRVEARAAALSIKREAPLLHSNPAHMFAWILLFAAMTAAGKTDGQHTGDSLPFWQAACQEGRANACERLLLLQATYCSDRSGWACNELAANLHEGSFVTADRPRARELFAQACELRFQPGCVNLISRENVTRAPPREFDLRLLLREGGRNLLHTEPAALHMRACRHGWRTFCEATGA